MATTPVPPLNIKDATAPQRRASIDLAELAKENCEGSNSSNGKLSWVNSLSARSDIPGKAPPGSPNRTGKYSSSSSKRAAAKQTAAQKLAGAFRANTLQHQSPREPFSFPEPASFRKSDIGSGRETFLPRYAMLQQVGIDVADSPRTQKLRAACATHENRSSAAASNIVPGVLDVRNKKLGDEYAFLLVREAMLVLGQDSITDAEPCRSVDTNGAGPNIEALLSGLHNNSSFSLHPEADEEAYFDLSQPQIRSGGSSKPRDLSHLVLRDNRLSDAGLASIMQCLRGKSSVFCTFSTAGSVSGSGARAVRQERQCTIRSNLKKLDVLDLSENNMRRRAALELTQLLDVCPSLRTLRLEKVGMNDSGLRALIFADPGLAGSTVGGTVSKLDPKSELNTAPQQPGDRPSVSPRAGSVLEEASVVTMGVVGRELQTTPGLLSLTSIDLSNNAIGDSGCVPLAALIRGTCCLRELNLGWNEIKDKGGERLALALSENSSIQKLDLSWNALGTKAEVTRNIAVALSNMLEKNSTLLHLDLGHNQLTPADCSIISTGLAANHSLMGLHMTGNGGSVNAYGELVPDAQAWPLESGHVMTRIIGENFQAKKLRKLRDSARAQGAAESDAHNHNAGRDATQWQLRNNCWICGGYLETEFSYTLTQKNIEDLLLKNDAEASAAAAIKAELKGEVLEKVADVGETGNPDDTPSSTNKELQPRRTEIPMSYENAISVKLVTSFDKWIAEEMGPTENTGWEKYGSTKNHVSKQTSMNLRRNRRHVGSEDQRACLLAASNYSFDNEEAAKEIKAAAAARAAEANAAAKRAESSNAANAKKGSKADPKGKLAVKTPAPPKEAGKKGKERPGNRKARKTVAPKRDPHVALITQEEFKAKLACIKANMAGAGNVIGTGGGTGDNADMATQESISNSFTHEKQKWIYAQENGEDYDYGIDNQDDLYAYYGGDTSPPAAADENAALLAEMMGKRKTIKKQVTGNKTRPKFSLHRMVPPGVHYYAFSVNGGPNTFDPFKPHVSTASLIRLGMYVPHNVKLPLFLNKLHIEEPTPEELMEGIDSLITPTCKPRDKNDDAPKELKRWTFKDSLFYESTAKNESNFIARCFNKDWQYTKASKGKNSTDVAAIEKVLRRHYTLICAVFSHYAALYSTELYFMSMGAFNEFIQRTRIIDGEQSRRVTAAPRKTTLAAAGAPEADAKPESEAPERPSMVARRDSVRRSSVVGNTDGAMNGTCTRTEVELVFVSACITGPRHEYNSKRALCRFQFLDCLVNIANVKYIKSNKCTDIESALKKLLKECVEPWAEREKPPLLKSGVNDESGSDDDSDDPYGLEEENAKPDSMKGMLIGEPLTSANAAFRSVFLYTKECDDMLRKHLPKLQAMYKKFSGEENTPLEEKTMCFKEWIALTDIARLQLDDFLTERMSKLNFIRSKTFYDDVFDESNDFKKLTFLEFLECIVRSAYSMHLEKQISIANSLEGGSGMAKNVLVRQESSSSIPRGSTTDLSSSIMAAPVSIVDENIANPIDVNPSIEELLSGAVSGVSDFLSVIELIAKKRV